MSPRALNVTQPQCIKLSLREDGGAPCKGHWTGKDLGDQNCDTAALKEFLETSFIVTCCSSQSPPSVAFTGSSGQLFLVSLQLRDNRLVKLSFVVCRLQSLQRIHVKNAKKERNESRTILLRELFAWFYTAVGAARGHSSTLLPCTSVCTPTGAHSASVPRRGRAHV